MGGIVIREVTMYQAVCDICGKAHSGPDGIVAWSDVHGALEMALGSDWTNGDGPLRCPECWEPDEDEDDGHDGE